ncbi:CHAT domain-containing protein [Nostoc sp.]|uniref:CHAT domain-containing protein n=1 Tax=Nostoc sp. TaxID=1180 RepID=UPI002FF53B78
MSERSRARAFIELLATKLATTSTAQLKTDPLPIQEIQQIAKDHKSTIVEYSLVNDQTLYVWVVKPNGKLTFQSVSLNSLGRPLKELVNSSRGSIGVRGRGSSIVVEKIDEPNQAAQLQKLHNLLIKPISAQLPTDPSAPVIIIPHQELFLVPFAALQDDKGKYLIEKHTLVIAPSIQVLQLTHAQNRHLNHQGGATLVVGNPTMPKVSLSLGNPPVQLPPLPGAEQEANAIARLLNTTALTGNKVTNVL